MKRSIDEKQLKSLTSAVETLNYHLIGLRDEANREYELAQKNSDMERALAWSRVSSAASVLISFAATEKQTA